MIETKIIPFKPEHFESLSLRECYASEEIKSIGTPALTYLVDGRPIAIVGGFSFMPGVMHVWALLSDEIQKRPVMFHKTIKHLIKYIFETYNLRRMQMSVRTDFPMGFRWARALGFSCEGIMNGYGMDNSAYWLFARLK